MKCQFVFYPNHSKIFFASKQLQNLFSMSSNNCLYMSLWKLSIVFGWQYIFWLVPHNYLGPTLHVFALRLWPFSVGKYGVGGAILSSIRTEEFSCRIRLNISVQFELQELFLYRMRLKIYWMKSLNVIMNENECELLKEIFECYNNWIILLLHYMNVSFIFNIKNRIISLSIIIYIFFIFKILWPLKNLELYLQMELYLQFL